MSNFSNSTTCDDDIKEASASVEDLPSRSTSASSSTITLINVLRINYTNSLNAPEPNPEDRSYPSSGTSKTKSLRIMKLSNQFENLYLNLSNFCGSDTTNYESTSLYENPPENEESNFSSATTTKKSPRIMKLGNQFESLYLNLSNFCGSDTTDYESTSLYENPLENEESNLGSATTTKTSPRIMKRGSKFINLHLDLSDFGSSESTNNDKYTTEPFKHQIEDDKCLLKKPCRKNRCKTNAFKALKSFAKNNNSSSSKNFIKKENIQNDLGVFKKLPFNNISRAFTDTNLESDSLEKQESKSIIDTTINTTIWLDNTKSNTYDTTFPDVERYDFTWPKSVSSIHSPISSINLSFLDQKVDWENSICPTYSTARPVNPQEEFKLRVPKAANKIDYLTRNCTFLLINEVRTNNPILILDFDALLIPLPSAGNTFLQYKTEISNFINAMYPLFNIAIWSASRMTVLVPRLNQLDMFDDQKIEKIMFCLDCTSIITAYVPYLGNTIVKPLELIWNLYPQFNNKSTIMVNEELKKFIFDQYGVPIGKTENQLIKHHELVTVANFLTEFVSDSSSFAKFNTQFWKKPWK